MAIAFYLAALAVGGGVAWLVSIRLPSIFGGVLAAVAGVVGAYIGLYIVAAIIRGTDYYSQLVHVMGDAAASQVLSSVASKILVQAAAVVMVLAFFGVRAGRKASAERKRG